MLYVNKQTWASQLFKNTQHHVEKTISPGQQRAAELSGSINTESDETLNEISAKLQQGMELSPSELEYLRVNAPDLYKEAVRMIELKKKIEQRLEQCKTKEEFSRAKSEITSQIAMECDVSPSKKCDIAKAKAYERRINLATKSFVKFAKTENFRNLPDTDAEYIKLKAEKLKEAFGDKIEISSKAKETEKTSEEIKAETPENTENTDAITQQENAKKLDAADNKKKKPKPVKEVSLYTKDYKPLATTTQTTGFEVKA
ncbi:MAG: hypothetical protein E7509_06425 [Ruminococcus sp.]|nr:hypothetical protein [Ruminococcus sp.]